MKVTQIDENMEPIASREIPDPIEVQIPLLSVRDYFAAAALTGIIHKSEQFGFPDRAVGYAAFRAYEYADAMLKERNRDDRP